MPIAPRLLLWVTMCAKMSTIINNFYPEPRNEKNLSTTKIESRITMILACPERITFFLPSRSTVLVAKRVATICVKVKAHMNTCEGNLFS